jgi:Flotillin
MESIDSIRILQVDGLPGLSGVRTSDGGGDNVSVTDGGPKSGNLAENVVNSALRYRAQAPFVDNLLQEIGMSANAMSSLGGLAVLPLTEEPRTKDTGKH